MAVFDEVTGVKHQPFREQPSREGNRALLIVLFVVYLLLLTWLVLWKLEIPWRGGGALQEIKLVPFAADDANGGSTPREVLANIVLFLPFGLYLGLLAPAWTWWKGVVVIAVASLVLEVAQFVLAVGSSDVTDLITNTVGGVVGLGLLALARRGFPARTTMVMTRVCLVGTVLAVLAAAVFVASPLRYAPPKDTAAFTGEGILDPATQQLRLNSIIPLLLGQRREIFLTNRCPALPSAGNQQEFSGLPLNWPVCAGPPEPVP